VHSPLSLLAKGRRWIVAVVALSFLVNLLVLTGPLYMLQVYDRVLASRSVDTLIVLSVIMAALFAFMGLFDHLRARIMARVGLLWTQAGREYTAAHPHATPERTRAVVRETDAVHRACSHPALLGALDIIWVPLIFAALLFLHPLLAAAALGGIVVSFALSIFGPMATRRLETHYSQSAGAAAGVETSLVRDLPVLESMGAVGQARRRWFEGREKSEAAAMLHGDAAGGWQAVSKTFRQFFQSVLLGLGAYLAIKGSLTPGAMIAGSILGGRALAPFDQLLSGLPVLRTGWTARRGLQRAFAEPLPAPRKGVLPEAPRAVLETTGAAYAPADKPAVVRDMRFRLEPGRCLAIFGASGSGKSAALRLMAGALRPTSGTILFDGIPLEDWPEGRRSFFISHLGQDALLPEGTIGSIIRSFHPDISDDEAIAAARAVGIHATIIALPQGYAQPVDHGGMALPYGLRRAILRAQALCGKRSILCLDDPTAGLDARETKALVHHLRERLDDGAAMAIISQEPDVLRLATHAMVLEKGRMVALGPVVDIVNQYAQILAEHGDPDRIPAALLPAVVRRLPAPPTPQPSPSTPNPEAGA